MSAVMWLLCAALAAQPGEPAAPATPGAADTPATLMAQAEQARARGELAASLELVRRAHALDPSPALLHNIAVLREALGLYDEAAQAFRGVIDDARTPPEVRARDRERLAALEPRLAQAWLVVTSTGPRGQIYLDREIIAVGEEVRASPGLHLLEVERPGDLWVQRLELPVGRRTTVKVAPGRSPATHAVVTLGHIVPPVSALELDGLRLRGVPPRQRVELPVGRRHLRYRPYGEAWMEATVELSPGQTIALGEAVAVEVPLVETAPPPAQASPGPWVLLAGGGAALAGGVVLSVLASSDRAQVEEALGDGQQVVTALTYARAAELEARADAEATAGAIALGVGVGALAAALVWWWSDGD